jgi:hypothetical protein
MSTENIVRPGFNAVLNALIEWGNSGLIPNTRVIRSYHPPAIDNITGVPVLVGATVYETKDFDYDTTIDQTIPKITNLHEKVTITALYRNRENLPENVDPSKPIASFRDLKSSVTDLPAAFYAGSLIQDFNVNNIPGSLDTALASRAPIKADLYKESALTSEDEEEYVKNIEKLRVPTVADRITTGFVDQNVKLITDNFEDAKTFYAVQPLGTEETTIPDNTPKDNRKPIPRRTELVPTGVPCAIPGVLNCYMQVYDSVDVSKKEYEYKIETVDMYYVPGTGLAPDGSIVDNGTVLHAQPLDTKYFSEPMKSIVLEDPTGDFPPDIIGGES